MDPQPSDETLASIYNSGYFFGNGDAEASQQVALSKRATARLYLQIIAGLVKGTRPRLLEIGCGTGDFLVEARSRGFEVAGIEYSREAAEVANANLQADAVRSGSIDSVKLSTNAYDVIAMFDVIEHLRNPAFSLKCLNAALKPGGTAVVVTPCLDAWSRRLLGRFWMEYKTEHLTYFSRKSLALLFESSGFDMIRFVPNYKILSLDYIARHFERFPVPFVSPLVRGIRTLVPSRLAHMKIKIVASGTMAIARKISEASTC
ncbi:MAG: class I SAM-dependent methyltransferase [Acidobacteriaceae bacterium]|nr:class I SAM-dependent methyltransferase [Acidobacteriaceae bacterium]MBV9302593.1 class I SAM-dependent methyltransferase [Acidobacteriaceae bacterium]MBV9767236.1 class I SAM-dependent methyltransferase [Acidobacteriaceae bacterium]